MQEAKSQLRKLVNGAVKGENVVPAHSDEPAVTKLDLRGWGKLKKFRGAVDAAFTPELDGQIARSLEDRRSPSGG